MQKKLYVLIPMLALACIAICQKKIHSQPHRNSITVSFTNTIGNSPIQPDSVYQNPFGERYAVTQFKYYISNIAFSNKEGKEVKVPNTYFLINEQDSASKSFTVNTPVSTITAIHFYIGVDSIKNISGVQTDALDPLNGMFWTWRTGYIMAKLEATSPLSKAPQQRVTYHIGGFTSSNNVVKKISLPLATPLKIKAGDLPTISIHADINKWFTGASNITIAEHNFCMNPGELANKIAANYVAMFSISTVSSN